MKTKIGIGTAQFGQNYGINNTTGQVSQEKIEKILNFALKNNIVYLDTAKNYGNSENLLSEYKRIRNFNIITKVSSNAKSIELEVQNSLSTLNLNSIYGCLLHDFKSFLKDENLFLELNKLKVKGLIKKIGFSVYFPSELEYLLNNKVNFDIIQLPYNLFDRRFEPFLKILFKKGIEIHIRSVFLQGLFFIDYKKLSIHFDSVKHLIQEVQIFCFSNQISVAELLLTFVFKSKYFNTIILGVNSVNELKENFKIEKFNNPIFKEFDFNKFIITNEKILIPYYWE